jgi:hypothetical protein
LNRLKLAIKNFGKFFNYFFFVNFFKRKESGCDWKQQLKSCENLEKTIRTREKADWEKIAEMRWKKDKEDEEKESNENNFQTNQIGLAPEEYQEMYHKTQAKKFKSHVHEADKILGKLFKFIPPKVLPETV